MTIAAASSHDQTGPVAPVYDRLPLRLALPLMPPPRLLLRLAAADAAARPLPGCR